MHVYPGERRANGLGCETPAVGPWGQHPPGFGLALDGWLDLSLEVRESHFPNESPAAFFSYHPESKTHQGPMSEVAQKPGPDLFSGERFAADIPSDLWVGPQSGATFEVLEPVTAKN
jgi:hypothetical protein